MPNDEISILNRIETLKKRIEELEKYESGSRDFLRIFHYIYDAVESTRNGIFIINTTRMIIYTNKSFITMFGYRSREDVIGTDAGVFFEKHGVTDMSVIRPLIESYNNGTENFSLKLKSGESISVEVSYSDITDYDQSVIGRLVTFIDITERVKLEDQKNQLIEELREANKTIKSLKGFIPICASCKKIRDDNGFWQEIEKYIREHSVAEFTHSICPECKKKLYPELPKDSDTER